MALKFTGSICLDTIPAECIKRGDNGHLYVQIAIIENDKPIVKNGEVVSDHFISCAPKKEERKEGAKYIFGNIKTWKERDSIPTAQSINDMPSAAFNPYQQQAQQQYQQPQQQQYQQPQNSYQQGQQQYQQPYQQQGQINWPNEKQAPF